MTAQLDDIKDLRAQATEGLAQAKTPVDLEAWRVAYIGRKGALPRLLRQVKELSDTDKKVVGAAANKLREELEDAYTAAAQTIGSGHTTIAEVSAMGDIPSGHLHPLTLTIKRVQDILAAMGFLLVEGPEVETAAYNFDLLNIPLEHPARAETDTFQIADTTDPLVLRTHTSPVQLRAVLEQHLTPPFKIASPGRVFRAERTDATHETTFYQFEGLMVGEDVAISDFKHTIATFYSSFFGKESNVRLRPSYFPFVEPGFEVDVSCIFCDQKGCRVCKHTGWIEIMGAGMVHPNVLTNMNIDPKKYQGFAFGGAIDRLAMLRHNVQDIRLFWSGDFRFLKQFS